MEILTIRGLPPSLMRDDWWFGLPVSGFSGGNRTGQQTQIDMPRVPNWAGLIGLLLAADFLFWGQDVGISLAVFVFLIFAVAVRDVRPVSQIARPAVLLIFAALPVVDYVQALSILFLITGLIIALIWARHPDLALSYLLREAARHLLRLPGRWFWTALSPLVALSRIDQKSVSRPGKVLRGFLRSWGFPIGGLLILSSLLISANPILSQALSFSIYPEEFVSRFLFWLGMAVLIWPLLDSDAETAMMRKSWRRRLPGLGINAASVARALVLFNAVMAVQTVMDFSILIGGAGLPEGMTYAEYAHRGAYPLLLTALLAGGFALAARPFLDEAGFLRPLMGLWLLQNILLCISAALRLDIYVETYGLTYLRLHAMIWMCLVVAGLALIGWQILARRSNGWLTLRCGALGLGTLYVCCFVNFAQVIAAHNLQAEKLDGYYLCQLGPMAHAAILDSRNEVYLNDSYCCPVSSAPEITNWRDFGLRKWRVMRKVAQVSSQEATT